MRLNVSPAYAVEEISKNLVEKADIESKVFEAADDVPDPRHLNPQKKNLLIFDDLQLEKQNKCEAYYIRGRHSNVDCFALHKINSSYQGRLLGKMQTLSVYFRKT